MIAYNITTFVNGISKIEKDIGIIVFVMKYTSLLLRIRSTEKENQGITNRLKETKIHKTWSNLSVFVSEYMYKICMKLADEILIRFKRRAREVEWKERIRKEKRSRK